MGPGQHDAGPPPSPGGSAAGPRRAFTLIELLVTVGVIAVLAALLLTVLGRARSHARSLACLNHLRQWALATQCYAGEHGDFLPQDGSASGTSTKIGWYVELPKAMGLPPYHQMPWRTNASLDPGASVWLCPSNPRRSNGVNLFHYCLNRHVNATGTGNRVRLGSIPSPALTVWIFDNGGSAPVAQQNNVHTNLHNHGAHFNFLDGHARRFSSRDYWDYDENRGRTNNPNLVWIPR